MINNHYWIVSKAGLCFYHRLAISYIWLGGIVQPPRPQKTKKKRKNDVFVNTFLCLQPFLFNLISRVDGVNFSLFILLFEGKTSTYNFWHLKGQRWPITCRNKSLWVHSSFGTSLGVEVILTWKLFQEGWVLQNCILRSMILWTKLLIQLLFR